MSKTNKSTYVKVADRVKSMIENVVVQSEDKPNTVVFGQVETPIDFQPVQLMDGISYRLVPAEGKLVVVETLTIKDGVIVNVERSLPNVPYMAYAGLIKQIGLSLTEIFNG